MKEVGIGLLGLGNVGSGVLHVLQHRGELIADRTGFNLVVRKIAVRDPGKSRQVPVNPSLLVTDPRAVVDDPSVQVVAELMGGLDQARELTRHALESGKPVVTANKALLAEHGDEMFSAAEKHQVDLYFEASVAGGIPIIRALREGLVANHIEVIHAILNGTCNYILTRMEQEGLPFDVVLKEAQEKGYAESEPSLDIDGLDSAHKAAILATLAYGMPVGLSDVEVEGIRGIAQEDIREAAELGYRIKLLAVVKHIEGDIAVRVQPTLVPITHTLAAVGGVHNAVLVHGDVVGETLYYGRGAGSEPTASAVVSDLVEVSRNLLQGSEHRVPPLVRHQHYGRILSSESMPCRYYLRISLLDQPDMLARVAHVLGDHGISIASVLQKDVPHEQYATVILVVDAASEGELREAIRIMDGLEVTGAPTIRFRIEDF